MNIKKTIASLFILFVFSLLFFTLKADAESIVKRISGQNMYETAVAISKDGWKSSDWAVIASGDDFPDALAAAPLAAKYNAPILLSGTGGLRSEVRQALEYLNVRNVFIIGGPGAVSPDVDRRLKDMGIEVIRIAGQDRYETAVKIAEELDGFHEIAVTTGEDFADALSIAPVAAKKQMPIILVPKDRVPDCVDKFIKSKSISRTYIIGDSTAVSFEVEIEFPQVERIGSLDRYFTNSSVERTFADILNSGKVFITSGEDFPDGLSGSVLAAMNNAPIVFLKKDYIKQAEYIFNGNYNEVVLLGDTSAISEEAENNLKSIGNIIKKVSSQKRFGYVYIDNIKTDGNWIYYHRKDFCSDDIVYGEESIYRMRADSTSNMKIATIGGRDVEELNYEYILGHRQEFEITKTLKDFFIKDEWIYYTLEGDAVEYKIKKDGTK